MLWTAKPSTLVWYTLFIVQYVSPSPEGQDAVLAAATEVCKQAHTPTSKSTHEWRERGVCHSPIYDLWCHAGEFVNRPTLFQQFALQVRKNCRADTEEAELD